MNIQEEFKNHLLFEFFHRDELVPLMEERGYSPDVDVFVVNFLEFAKLQINQTFSEGPFNKVYTEQDCNGVFDGMKNPFFNNFLITLTFTPSDKGMYKGGLFITKSFYDDSDGKVVCQPNLHIEIWGKDEVSMAKTMCFCLGHELTHAYNLYCYLMEKNLSSSELESLYYKQNYGSIRAEMAFGNRDVGNMVYLLNRMERNAYIAQLKQELAGMKDEITDSKSAYGAITKTESYKMFCELSKSIEKLNSIPEDTIKTLEILRSLNRVSKKQFKSLKQAKKYFNAQWEKWKKKYMAMASKIAFDVFNKGRIMTTTPKIK